MTSVYQRLQTFTHFPSLFNSILAHGCILLGVFLNVKTRSRYENLNFTHFRVSSLAVYLIPRGGAACPTPRRKRHDGSRENGEKNKDLGEKLRLATSKNQSNVVGSYLKTLIFFIISNYLKLSSHILYEGYSPSIKFKFVQCKHLFSILLRGGILIKIPH